MKLNRMIFGVLVSVLLSTNLMASDGDLKSEVFTVPDTSIKQVKTINDGPMVINGFRFSIHSSELVMGKIYILVAERIDGAEVVPKLVGGFGGVEIPFYARSNEKNIYEALLAIPLNYAEGIGKIQMQAKSADSTDEFEIPVYISLDTSIQGIVEHLSISEGIIRPDDIKTVSKLAQEEAEMNEFFVVNSNTRYWNLDQGFRIPIPSKHRMSSAFGVTRYWNRNPQRRTHWGIDLAAPVGTKVYATAPGRILAAKNYHFSGKSIIIDHGNGVITLYGHLNTINVKVGQLVNAKTIIGKVGRTGKATGPTLHFQAVVNRVKVNPESLMRIAI